MRANYSINLDQFDEANLKLSQGVALLKILEAAQNTEGYENLDPSEKTDGLHVIITLLTDVDGLLNDEAINE